MHVGWFRQAHIKSEASYRIQLLVSQRRNFKCKLLDMNNSTRHSLNAFGIWLNEVGRGSFEKTVLDAVKGDRMTLGLMQATL